ncbi:MAG: T9SS type A sorting domain-containing protein [Flammeovirgaceae bacterium]|nr:T9SS type A sorting domain-containing protein [Flammeovirgaceae bacterium]
MKNLVVFILFFGVYTALFGQTRTISSSGNWDATGTWTGGNIADVLSEDVAMNNSTSVTVQSGFNYTVGNYTTNNTNTITIDNGGQLNLGDASNSRDFNSNNNTVINVDGILIIWGDLVVNNNLVLNVTGTLIIKGNIDMNNGGSLTISGNMDVDGDFIGGNNTSLDVDGTLNIDGNVSVGNNSTATGTGSITVGGSCSDGSSANFCGQGPFLPVELGHFSATFDQEKVRLNWSTLSELDFDHFEIERSVDNLEEWKLLGSVWSKANGYSTFRIDYEYIDESPLLGYNYYRLKAVDFNGSYEYFGPVLANYEGEARQLIIYPNPSIDRTKLNFRTNFTPGEFDVITLLDHMGLSMGKAVVNYNVGTVFSYSEMKPGVYFLKYSGSFNKVVRVIVQ